MPNERTPVTDPNEIWLGGFPYRLSREVGVELANIFSRKVNQGDPGPDDHPTFSTSIQRDWSGGGLVKFMNPASDTGRFWWSTAETQYPAVLALPPATDSYASPSGQTDTPWVIGDFNDRLLVAWGTAIYGYDAITGAFTFQGNSASSPNNNGTPYRELSDTSAKELFSFVPTATGYTTVSTAGTVQAGTDTISTISFEVWDNKIFKLLADGSLWYATFRPALAADWLFVTQIPDGSRPRVLTSYMDRSNNPTLMVVTDGSTFKLDFANRLLHKDDLAFPRHPHQGRAAVNHKGDFMVSVGTGIHRYDNNTISAMGLDSRDGMPPEYQGFIRDMETTYNGLYVLLQGERTIASTGGSESATLNLGGGDDQLYVAVGQTQNLVMLWNGFGWHYRWRGQGLPPNNIAVSNAQDSYTIWWGSNGTLHRQVLERTYFNPGNPDTAGHPFAPSAEHISSWNEWGWIDQDKILKQVEFKVKKMEPGCRVTAYYRVDNEDAPWVLLTIAESDGEYRVHVGRDDHEYELRGGKGHFKGVRHHRYQLRFTLQRGSDATQSPVIEWHTVVARRWLRPQRVWRVGVDMQEKVKDHTVDEQVAHIHDMAIRQEAIVFEHQDDQFMVELILMEGPEKPGRDKRTVRELTLMEANELDHPDETGFSNANITTA